MRERVAQLGRLGRRLRHAAPGAGARRAAIEEEVQALSERPKISLVMPTYRPPRRYLREAIRSVRAQAYPEWELIVVDDGSKDPATIAAIESEVGQDPRAQLLALTENQGISGATNAGVERCSGEFIGFIDHDDALTPDSLLRVAQALAAEPDLDVVYSDQDKLTVHGRRADPFLKPDFSPVYALGAMFIGHLLVVRRELVDAVGGFDSSFDTIQDFEFFLRVSERTERIHHVPEVIYHWRAIPGSIAAGAEEKSGVPELQARAVSSHLERIGAPAIAVPHPTIPHRAVLEPRPGADSAAAPSVTAIVSPDPDGPPPEPLLELLAEGTDYPGLEVRLAGRDFETPAGPFRRGAANQAGAAGADSELLLFIEPTLLAEDRGWLRQLVLPATLPKVAAVGPLLAAPDGRVESAGHAIGLRDPVMPITRGFDSEGDGYYGSMPCAREVSALGAECLLVRRSDFERVGGFDPAYEREFEDFDLSLRLLAAGGSLVYTPRPRLVTRAAARRRLRDPVDRALFVDLHYDRLLAGDPFYNASFDRAEASYDPAGWREKVARASSPLGWR